MSSEVALCDAVVSFDKTGSLPAPTAGAEFGAALLAAMLVADRAEVGIGDTTFNACCSITEALTG